MPVTNFIDKDSVMEFPIEFELDIPKGTPTSEVHDRQECEASRSV